jgi:hypothetical protein
MRMLFTREQLSFKHLWLPLYAQGEWHSRGVQQQVVSPQDEQREPTQHVPQLFWFFRMGLIAFWSFRAVHLSFVSFWLWWQSLLWSWVILLFSRRFRVNLSFMSNMFSLWFSFMILMLSLLFSFFQSNLDWLWVMNRLIRFFVGFLFNWTVMSSFLGSSCFSSKAAWCSSFSGAASWFCSAS